MAGLTGRTQMAAGINSWLNDLNLEMKKDASLAGVEAMQAGLAAARFTIDNTPSDLSRMPKNNRNWTHTMNDSLGMDIKDTGTTITIRVGWLDKKEAYFLIQEDGGEVNHIMVSPMHALLAADKAMRASLATKGIL